MSNKKQNNSNQEFNFDYKPGDFTVNGDMSKHKDRYGRYIEINSKGKLVRKVEDRNYIFKFIYFYIVLYAVIFSLLLTVIAMKGSIEKDFNNYLIANGHNIVGEKVGLDFNYWIITFSCSTLYIPLFAWIIIKARKNIYANWQIGLIFVFASLLGIGIYFSGQWFEDPSSLIGGNDKIEGDFSSWQDQSHKFTSVRQMQGALVVFGGFLAFAGIVTCFDAIKYFFSVFIKRSAIILKNKTTY